MASKEFKLDIFKLLSAIQRKDRTYFNKLTDEEKKGFSALLANRYLSTANVGKSKVEGFNFDEFFLLMLNERSNLDLFTISSKHPEISYLTLTTLGLRTNSKYQWMNFSKKAKSFNKLDQFIMNFFPGMNNSELKLWKQLNTSEDITDLGKDLGLTEKETKDYVSLFEEEKRT